MIIMKTNLRTIPRFVGILSLLVLLSLSCAWGSVPSNLIEKILPSSGAPAQKPLTIPTFASPSQGNFQVLSSQDEALTKLYEQVNPGVVAIWVITPRGISQGTGFVIDMEGHVVTNYHVVEGVERVEVNFSSGFKVYGDIIARDLDSDLGVIKVNAPADQLHPLPLGDSDKTRIGQTAVAIGNPFGLSGTMTIGIISGKGRTSSSLRATPGGDYFTSSDMIQTDAAINPGNSGGPLLNLQGEVIGVNRAIQTNSYNDQGSPVNTGVGFAVAINIVKRVLPVLISSGKYDYPYLGLEGLPELTLEAQKQLNLASANGIYVTRLTNDGPSLQAGIRQGDLVVAVDHRAVNTFGDMISYLFNNKTPGETVTFTIIRGKDQIEIPVKLDRRP